MITSAIVIALIVVIIAVIGTLGVGFVTYTGVDALLNSLKLAIESDTAGLSSEIINMMGLLGVDVAIKIILASIAAGLTARGLLGGFRLISRISPL